jgi:hypothetical protein
MSHNRSISAQELDGATSAMVMNWSRQQQQQMGRTSLRRTPSGSLPGSSRLTSAKTLWATRGICRRCPSEYQQQSGWCLRTASMCCSTVATVCVVLCALRRTCRPTEQALRTRRYISMTASCRNKRKLRGKDHDPATPDITQKMSKRTWDGIVSGC